MTFRNWAALEPPVSRRRQPRTPLLQSDRVAAERARVLRASVERGYICDRCSVQANLLHPVEGNLVCTDCRDA